MCVYERDIVSVLGGFFSKHWQPGDESDRRMKGARRPRQRSSCQNCVISLLAHCPLLVQQHIIGDGALCVSERAVVAFPERIKKMGKESEQARQLNRE